MRALAAVLVAIVGCRPTEPPTRAPAPAPATEAGPTVPDEEPQPVAQRINTDYADADAKRWTRSFEHDGREVYDHRDEIVAALGLRPGMAVADVGAGTGLFTLAMARAVGPNGRVFAVDVQPEFLATIAERARAADLANVVTVTADQRASGLAEASVDLAFLCDSYHHLERPRSYLADLRRALRPGGRLVVVDYDRTAPAAKRWMKDHVRADPDEFLHEIEAAGFELRDRPALLRENFVLVLAKA